VIYDKIENNMSRRPLKKILIIAPAWVGDMVMMHSLLRYLKQQNSQIILHVLTKPSLISLTQYMPEVSKTIEFSCDHGELGLKKRYRLGKKLKVEKYDQAIVLPNSFKSAFIPFFAKIPIRTGWRGEYRYGLLNDVRILDKKKYPLMIQRALALGMPKRQYTPVEIWPDFQADPTQAIRCIEQFYIDIHKPLLVLCPGAAFGISKQWPGEYFATVALEKAKQKFQIVILGSADDQAIADRIMQSVPCLNLVGKTTLSEAVNLLSRATVVMSNDSGLMHIAAALGRPLVAIYGSSTPGFTPPLTKHVKILERQLDCHPCFKRVCPLVDPLKHMACLKGIKPKTVLNAIEELCQ